VPAAALAEWLAAQPARGEYVLVIEAAGSPAAEQLNAQTERWLVALAAALPASKAATVAAQATGLKRDLLYARLIALRGDPD
jgi:16S rRNA (cytidine1402-2'-O)-methyltransferase